MSHNLLLFYSISYMTGGEQPGDRSGIMKRNLSEGARKRLRGTKMRPRNAFEPPEDGLPPQEVRILSLRAEPWPEDSRRVRIHLEITPFIERPNMDVSIQDQNGNEVSSISIIENIEINITFTMHIRSEEVSGVYTAAAGLYYPDHGTVDQKSISFEITENNS